MRHGSAPLDDLGQRLGRADRHVEDVVVDAPLPLGAGGGRKVVAHLADELGQGVAGLRLLEHCHALAVVVQTADRAQHAGGVTGHGRVDLQAVGQRLGFERLGHWQPISNVGVLVEQKVDMQPCAAGDDPGGHQALGLAPGNQGVYGVALSAVYGVAVLGHLDRAGVDVEAECPAVQGVDDRALGRRAERRGGEVQVDQLRPILGLLC